MTDAADDVEAFEGPDLERLRKAAALMPVKERLEKYRKIDRIVLHPKQRAFVDLGSSVSERALFAGSQQGKSMTGAYEMVQHLTGDYEPAWHGRRFPRAVNAWAIGPSAQHVRDVMQAKLCGNVNVLDGLIPLESYADKRPSRSHALSDMFDQIRVKHKSGGESLLTFKSFEQGREKLQGAGVDVIWTDEDCPVDIFTELVARTIATAGMVYATFTPIKGCLPVAQRFLQEQSPSRGHVIMELKDALHIPVERHAEIIASIPEHERDARVYGIPSAGEGKVFQVSEDMIKEVLNPSSVPEYWPLAWALDFGHTKNHPFAAVLGAWDRTNDIIHIIHALRVHGGLPINHASAMRSALNGLAADVTVIWPHDGHAPSRESNRSTMQLYKAEGLRMQPDHATFEKGGFDFEAGLSLMHGRLASSKLRVAAHLTEWFQEYRMYHRIGGLVNKINDDLMSATRILCMSIRKAKELQNHRPWFESGIPYRQPRERNNGPPPNDDYDIFNPTGE